MVEQDTVYCPQCGYNLFGLPEHDRNLLDLPAHRCPECGFHYDWPAIRALAKEYADASLALYRSALRSAIIATGVSLMASLPSPWFSVVFAVVGVIVGVVIVIAAAAGAWRLPLDLLWIPIYCIAIVYPIVLAIIPLGFGLACLVRRPSDLLYLHLSLPPAVQAQLNQAKLLALLSVAVATVVVVGCWR
jgi:hypothetical protein